MEDEIIKYPIHIGSENGSGYTFRLKCFIYKKVEKFFEEPIEYDVIFSYDDPPTFEDLCEKISKEKRIKVKVKELTSKGIIFLVI
jgi:hypothetical protein